MSKRAAILVIAAIIGGILFFGRPLRAADPTPLACPNEQTVFLTGRAPPGEALLVFLQLRAVGGGLADQTGAFSLPLRARERPGVYPVEVRLRSTNALVARFVCYVDLPLDTTAEVIETTVAATAPPAPRAPTAPQTTPASVTPRPTGTGGPSPLVGTTTPTVTIGTAQTTTASASPTAGPSPTASPTIQSAAAGNVEIAEVVLRDPRFPAEGEESVTLRNATASQRISLARCRLINASRPGVVQPFVFPGFILGPKDTVSVISEVGDDNLDVGDFYWDQPNDVWRVGDRVELRDASNNLIDTILVPQQE